VFFSFFFGFNQFSRFASSLVFSHFVVTILLSRHGKELLVLKGGYNSGWHCLFLLFVIIWLKILLSFVFGSTLEDSNSLKSEDRRKEAEGVL